MDAIAKHILSTSQFDLPFLIKFMRTVEEIKKIAEAPGGEHLLLEVLRGKMVGRFFWPPSSRTFHQFSVAAQKLGAGGDSERGLPKEIIDSEGKKKIVFELPFSSEMKGAFFEDEIRAWASAYYVLILRHHEEGYVTRAASILDSFQYDRHVINAGDGPGQHPSQALIDLLTILYHFHINIEREWGRLKDMSIAFIGDNRMGRTVHSLAPLLGRLGFKIIFISLPILTYPIDKLRELDESGTRYEFRETLCHADIFYVTRPNIGDYFPDEEARIIDEYLKQHAITQEVVMKYQPKLVLHPFPRRKEIPIWLPGDPATHHISIDHMPQAGYFQQMDYGVLVRMALLKMVAAPYVDIGDLYASRWNSTYTRQCICGRVENSILGWNECPQPPYLFLPKALNCSFCKT
ncbi:MAG: aspartate carbamoyltransferase [Parcubacteria group bacterium Gr01-1014_70]|nr:MAG: aspartate carbamoyltransferase [Parcubacteria group bacterium Gr01-1014_70]